MKELLISKSRCDSNSRDVEKTMEFSKSIIIMGHRLFFIKMRIMEMIQRTCPLSIVNLHSKKATKYKSGFKKFKNSILISEYSVLSIWTVYVKKKEGTYFVKTTGMMKICNESQGFVIQQKIRKFFNQSIILPNIDFATNFFDNHMYCDIFYQISVFENHKLSYTSMKNSL